MSTMETIATQSHLAMFGFGCVSLYCAIMVGRLVAPIVAFVVRALTIMVRGDTSISLPWRILAIEVRHLAPIAPILTAATCVMASLLCQLLFTSGFAQYTAVVVLIAVACLIGMVQWVVKCPLAFQTESGLKVMR